MNTNRPPTPTLTELLRAYEKLVIMETLRRNGWNRGRAAAALKISRRRLQRRLAALKFSLSEIPRDAPGRKSKKEEGA